LKLFLQSNKVLKLHLLLFIFEGILDYHRVLTWHLDTLIFFERGIGKGEGLVQLACIEDVGYLLEVAHSFFEVSMLDLDLSKFVTTRLESVDDVVPVPSHFFMLDDEVFPFQHRLLALLLGLSDLLEHIGYSFVEPLDVHFRLPICQVCRFKLLECPINSGSGDYPNLLPLQSYFLVHLFNLILD
jgi:hypothetical protein